VVATREEVLIDFCFGTNIFVRVVLTIFDLPRRIVVVFLVCPKAAQAKTSNINIDKTNGFFIFVMMRLLNFIDRYFYTNHRAKPSRSSAGTSSISMDAGNPDIFRASQTYSIQFRKRCKNIQDVRSSHSSNELKTLVATRIKGSESG
jgi:hypothetical protein